MTRRRGVEMRTSRRVLELRDLVDALQNRVDTYYSNLLFHFGTDKVEDTPPPFYKGGIEAFRRDVKAAKLLEYGKKHNPSNEEALAYMLRIGMYKSDLLYVRQLLIHEVEASDDFKTVLLWVHFIMRMEEDERALAEAEKELADVLGQ
jgi:hypothetical protein